MSRLGRFVKRAFGHKKKRRGFFLVPDDPITTPIIIPPDPLFGQLGVAALIYSAIDIYNTFIAVYVQRTNGFDGNVTCQYRLLPGTALPGVDYTDVSGTLTFFDKSQNQQVIIIPILSRNVSGDFEFQVELHTPGGGAEIQPGRDIADLTIQRRGNGSAAFAGEFWYIQNPTPNPPTTVTIYVQRNLAFKGAVSVDFHTSDGTAVEGVDYTGQTGTLSWADTDASPKAIIIEILPDAALGDRDFFITLDNPIGGIVIDTPNPATVTITEGVAPDNPTVTASVPNQIVDDFAEDENEQLIYENEAFVNNNFLVNSNSGLGNLIQDIRPGVDLNGVANVFDGGISIAVGPGGVVLYSNALGTWLLGDSGVLVDLYGVAFRNMGIAATAAIAVGDGGTILKSTDHGATWTPKTSGTLEDLRAVWFVDASIAVAVGKNGTILKSTDIGETWAPLVSGTSEDLNGIFFGFATTQGWIVGTNGTILKTVDIDNWAPQTSGTAEDLHDVWARDGSVAYAVGNNGTILRTPDGGANWNAQTSGTSEDLYGISAYSTSFAYVVGDNGTILRTEDSGANWDPVTSPTSGGLRDIAYTNTGASVWIAVGPNMTPIITYNDGMWFNNPISGIGTPPATSNGGIDYSNGDDTFQPTSRFNMKGLMA